MVNTISLKKLRPELPAVIKNIDSRLDRYVVIKRGRPVAVMINPDDFEGLLETIEILSDKDAVKRIRKAKKEIAAGKTISMEQLRRKLEKKANV
ncbi:MAG: type II toxin-antitoxin system Phd/YefM family antitoxin [Candidatus Omnitrophica bacterium]|jgi:PHD/YefM family antitoxin component YafN of YafNO toxin-antitoxin module|nr:type II toxin-antitoxin system Phd/YefM family antitoxin [Candidatus Omnitrophota bacterium]